jgi:hypothetical protein
MAKRKHRRMVKAGPFISTPRARQIPGQTVRLGGVVVIESTKEGQEPIHFEKGGLHKALHVPQDQPIPEDKKQAALEGKYGQKIKREAIFAFLGALAKGRETLKRRRRWCGVNRPISRRPEPETLLYR